MSLAIDLDLRRGSFHLQVALPPHEGTTVVVGPNGAGKSTLLECMLGVQRSEGRIELGGDVLLASEEGVDVPPEERRLGYVPQRYALFRHMTVLRNVAFGIKGGSRAERDDRARDLLDELGAGHLARRKPAALSGGESQRVALARALSIEPRALLLDEPLAALDVGARRRVRDFLGSRLREVGVPTVVVSHDLADAVALAERVVVLEAGRVAQVGSLATLRNEPASPFVAAFFSEHPEPAPSPGDTGAA